MSATAILPPDFGPTHTIGYMADPDGFFSGQKAEMRAEIGERLLGLADVKMNQILVGVWRRPEKRNGLIIPETADLRREQEYQGKTGLVLKLGPRAYVSDENVTYEDADKVTIGDWVVFRAGEGMRLRLHGWDCILTTERGIKMRVPRPDEVY
jgi:hypothetical protein